MTESITCPVLTRRLICAWQILSHEIWGDFPSVNEVTNGNRTVDVVYLRDAATTGLFATYLTILDKFWMRQADGFSGDLASAT